MICYDTNYGFYQFFGGLCIFIIGIGIGILLQQKYNISKK
jgi:hypothetical protein